MARRRLGGALCRLFRGERARRAACRLDLQVERGLQAPVLRAGNIGVCHLCRGIVVARRARESRCKGNSGLTPCEERSTMKSLRALAALCALLLTGAAGAQTIGIVTTPAGSFSNSAGQAIAKMLVEKAKLRAIVQAQASTGFDEVESGSADFNVSNSFDATFYSTGTGEYEGRGKQPAMRYAGSLIPYRVAMHVRADSRINSITDLKAKHGSTEFNAQKTIARIIEAHLANMGLGYGDVVKVPAPNVVRPGEDFISGKVDVLVFALGSAAIKQANASVGGLRVLEVGTSPDAIKRTRALLPGAYVMQVAPN